MSNAGKPEGDNYLLKSTTRWSCRSTARCASSPPPTTSSTPGWCRRWRQAGCHSGLRARHLFRAEKTGDSTASARAVRQGTRLHADPRQVVSHADYAAWVAARRRKWRRCRRSHQDLATGRAGGPRREGLQRNCAACHRPDGKGAGPIKPLDGSAIVLNDPGAAARHPSQRPPQRRHAVLEAALGHRTRRRHDLHKNSWSNQTGKLVQPAEVMAARK